ncbi:acyltransferase [Rhodanobacter glycinis]|uniref:Acyltransferase n=1 Tax=Rhodanobacter glycinis TaxID=582702 RepID=A0A502CDL3_9GAMM|nr:acyltransferase [Rhodanobacter glycinis]TPG10714.1 acyltransferase [Rhodanobacter glycinis]TPG51075.1 acyltransferase [Rhodanobacter glycinis]
MREPIPDHDKLNNFDGLRLFAALLVLFSHQFVFLGSTEPAPVGDSLGMVAVMMFFVMSGYLVSESWYRDPHLMRFASRRLLRIWPGLAAAAVAIALVSAAITVLPLHDYFGSGTRKFILANFKFETIYRLPGVFDTVPANPSLSAVNGSWWTIPVEARCYAYLAVLGAIGMRRRLLSVVVLGLVTLMYVKTLPGHSKADPFDNISFFYTAFFMTGVCARQYIEELQRHRLALLGAIAVVIVTAVAFDQPRLGEWAVIAPLTLVLGSLSTPVIRSANRFGDLSYGIYLYAYFLQQLTVRLWPGQPSFGASVTIATLATVMVAWCSWHAVEAPSLRLKHRLRRWFPNAAA